MVRVLKLNFSATTVGFGQLSPDQMQVELVLEELNPQERAQVLHKSILVEKEAYDRAFSEIRKAVLPLKQLRVMDRNLLSVWYFASDKARVCVSGLGPDEYLGGYKRIK